MSVLSIRGLEKSFGKKVVLRGLDLEVPEHSIFGLVGRNGAGKTTAMKAVLGLLKCDKGEIYVAGEAVQFGETATNRFISYIPDVPDFYPFLTAPEYLSLCGESLGMSKEEVKVRSEELLALVGLKGETNRIKGYSRGMKQRLGIAEALLGRPKLLICDEPTSALDPIGRKEVLDLILSVREQTTVIFSTHILSDVERICTDVALLDGGVIAMRGTVRELKASHLADRETVIEVQNESDLAILTAAYPNAVRADGRTLIIAAEEAAMSDVISFIAERHIPVQRIERSEPTLESVFMEAVSS